ncbi:MAG: hypothetical protein C5B50_07615 [Verrucomicrobia bacterium]|nr:MAG: hypothetical protein C5B50_07615 [Verrucomicrobiota bacterium]
MLGFAVIRKEGFPKESLDRDRWRSLITEFPELKRIDSVELGGQPYPVPDSAELLEEGKVVGGFIWEKGQIYVDGPRSMFPLAKGIAEILEAGVFDKYGDEIIELPEDQPLPTGSRTVRYHLYADALDLTGKDLVSSLERNKEDVARLIGNMVSLGEMKYTDLPVERMTTMNGEMADEVHEWPNAMVGSACRHLVLHLRNNRLIGFRWTFTQQPPTVQSPHRPWYRRFLGQ